jgi:spore germination protein KC
VPIAGQDFATAGVRVDPQGGQDIATPFTVQGLAVFRGGRQVGWLDGGAALGWATAAGHLQHQAMTVNAGGVHFTVDLLGEHRRVSVQPGADGPQLLLRANVYAHLVGGGPPGGGELTGPSMRALEHLAASALANDVDAALAQARALGSDVFGLGEYVRVRDPRWWQGVQAAWSARYFPQVPVSVRIQVQINSIGSELCPLLAGC